MCCKCLEQLTRRQMLIVRNPLIDINLMKACRNELRENNCVKRLKETESVMEKLSVILLCLGSIVRNGKLTISLV
jgi:hypothetical protein